MSNLDSELAPQQGHETQKDWVMRVLLTLFGILCFVCLLFWGGFGSFVKLVHPDYPWLIAAFVGTGLMIYVFSVRWCSIVNSLVGRKLITNIEAYLYSLSSLLAGNFIPHTATTTIGKAAALMKFKDVSFKSSGASVLLDKLFDGFFMLMFSWPVLLLIAGKTTIVWVAVICLVEFVIVTIIIFINFRFWICLLQGIITSVVKVMGIFPFVRRHTQLHNIATTHKIKDLELLKKTVVLKAYFLTALGQSMLAVRSWLAAMAIGLNMITPLETFVAIGLVQASILISFTPGALGFADGAWFITLESAGVPKEIITVFLVAHRIIENLAILLCWLPLYFYKIWRHNSVNKNRFWGEDDKK